jgi:hypothetical protein
MMSSLNPDGLYETDWNAPPLQSSNENTRVRELLDAHLDTRVREGLEPNRGSARGAFARDWVQVCDKLGLRGPAQGRDLEHRIDAGRTPQRHLLAGRLMPEWVLLGIECTICERKGLALPGKAYEVQQTLV